MLPISRGMLMSGSRGMVQPGKGRRKRVCRRIRKLLDKKSKSQGRKKSLVLERKIMLLPGRTISASRRKWRKNSRIRKITTGGILTGSRRKKGNTTKNGCRRNTGAGKTQKIVPLRKMFLRRIREMPFRRMAVLILRAVKSCKKNSGRLKKPGRRYRRQGQSCQRQGNTLCREYLTRKPGRENMWLFLWIRKNPSGRRAYPKQPCAGCGMRAGILCMGRLLKRRKKIQRWRAHTNQSRKGKNCFLSSKGR